MCNGSVRERFKMPFIAIREDGAGRVYINDFDDPKTALAGVEFYCQDCRAPMYIRAGDYVRPHFAHMPGYDDRPCWYKREGESDLHREAKQRIAAALAGSEVFAGGQIEIEYPVDKPQGRRYVDVYIELPDGRRYAHEAQLSGQTIAAFAERTAAYRAVGLNPVWWLGNAARTTENITWVKSHCDYVGELEVRTSTRTLIDERYDDNEGTPYGGNGRREPYGRQVENTR